MFTGIIEQTGMLRSIEKQGSNLCLHIEAALASELKVDQSVAHNGVCLTVVRLHPGRYEVVAIDETLKRSNLGLLKQGALLNLERCMKLGDRLDGHIVQGHVDTMAEVKSVTQTDGSWIFRFVFPEAKGHITVEKGSICVNGVSLTVVDSVKNEFSVAIIPYTWEHTNFHLLQPGDKVNIEFDVIGKYVARLLAERGS